MEARASSCVIGACTLGKDGKRRQAGRIRRYEHTQGDTKVGNGLEGSTFTPLGTRPAAVTYLRLAGPLVLSHPPRPRYLRPLSRFRCCYHLLSRKVAQTTRVGRHLRALPRRSGSLIAYACASAFPLICLHVLSWSLNLHLP